MKVSAVVLAFLLGIASIAVFETILTYQASNCSDQRQATGINPPSDAHPSTTQKSDDGSHERKQKTVSVPFACGIAGFFPAVRQFMNHNEGFVVGGFTFLLVFVTGWLVYVTGGLRESTEKLWLAGEKQIEVARIGANAADRSAKAAIAMQLPIIRITPHVLSHGDGIVDGKPYENCAVHFVVIANLGPTKAFPKEIAYGSTIGNDLPPEPSYQWIDSFSPNYIIEPDPKITPRKYLQGQKMLEAGQRAEINKGNYVWFYCMLLYDDFMGDARSHGFCWRWSYTGDGLAWRIEGNPAYNRKT